MIRYDTIIESNYEYGKEGKAKNCGLDKCYKQDEDILEIGVDEAGRGPMLGRYIVQQLFCHRIHFDMT